MITTTENLRLVMTGMLGLEVRLATSPQATTSPNTQLEISAITIAENEHGQPTLYIGIGQPVAAAPHLPLTAAVALGWATPTDDE